MQMKLGIVGFGFMGHCDADMMATFPDEQIRLVAVADTNPEQLKDAPEGVETYGGLDEMLAKADFRRSSAVFFSSACRTCGDGMSGGACSMWWCERHYGRCVL